MTSGIYGYWDNEKGYYAYVGRDSDIHSSDNRNYNHNKPSRRDEQQINRVLQDNPDRYEYRVLMEGDYNDNQLNKMEKFCIKHLKTYRYDYPDKSVFNFTKGGDGISGYKLPEKTKQKLSDLNKGKNHPQWKGYPTIQKSGTSNGKQRYCIYYDGKEIKWSIDRGKLESFLNKHYDEIINKEEIKTEPEYKLKTYGRGYNNKQRYCIRGNGKRLKQSVHIEKLEEWFKDNYPNEKLIKEV